MPTPPKSLPWLIAAAFFMQMLDGTILNTALPEVAKGIGENPLEIQMIVVAYMLAAAFFLPVSGWLADYFGSKKVFISAITIFTIGSLLCSLSDTLTELILSRIFQGMGGALMVPVGRLIVVSLYPKEQLVKVLSFITLPALLGPLLGPVLGGFLVEYASWHWIFLINIPIGIMAYVFCLRIMPDIAAEKYKFDWIGFLFFALGMVLMCLPFNDGNLGLTPLQKNIMLSFSALSFITYWFYAKRVKRPLFNLKIFKNLSFAVGNSGNLLSRLGGSSIPFLTPLFLQLALGYSPSQSGTMILFVGLSMIVAKAFVAKILNFLGYRKFLVINTLTLGILISGFSFVDTQTPELVIIGFLIFFGFINSMQFTAMITLTLIDLPKTQTTEGNTILSVVIQLSMVMGISIGAVILHYFSGAATPGSTELIDAFHITYRIVGGFTIFSALNFLFTPKNAGKILK